MGELPLFAGILAINLLAAEGETSPVVVYKNGEYSSYASCRGRRSPTPAAEQSVAQRKTLEVPARYLPSNIGQISGLQSTCGTMKVPARHASLKITLIIGEYPANMRRWFTVKISTTKKHYVRTL